MNTRTRLRQKWPWLAMYVLLLAGGLLAFFYKSPTVAQYLRPWVVAVWSSFFVLGGSVSSYGLLRGGWAGEYVGIPFLSSALAVYGSALVASGIGRSNSVAIVTGLIILAFATGLLGRWVESRQMLKIARDA